MVGTVVGLKLGVRLVGTVVGLRVGVRVVGKAVGVTVGVRVVGKSVGVTVGVGVAISDNKLESARAGLIHSPFEDRLVHMR